MERRKRSLFCLTTILFMTIPLLVVGNFPVFAATEKSTTTTVTINSGPFEITESPSDTTFTSIQLNGEDQFTTADVSTMIVTDARGTGAGWHLTASATPFTSAGSDTLPSGSLFLYSPATVTPMYQGATVTPDLGAAFSQGPASIDDGPRVLLNAVPDAGLGKWEIGWDNAAEKGLQLNINPGVTKATTYTSTITWTLATVPQ